MNTHNPPRKPVSEENPSPQDSHAPDGGLNEELGDLDPADADDEDDDDGHLPGHIGGGLAGG